MSFLFGDWKIARARAGHVDDEADRRMEVASHFISEADRVDRSTPALDPGAGPVR